MSKLCFFVTTPRGLEPVLQAELERQGVEVSEVIDGGIRVKGDWSDCYRINLHSRVAGKVLWQVGQGRFRDEADIYQQALKLPWNNWFDVNRSIKIRHSSKNTRLKSPRFTVLKLKDAICDVFRKRSGGRPNVAMDDPDIQVNLYLEREQYWIYIDTSGDALFKRGWRTERVTAPIRENLAAGILELCQWDSNTPLFDPMCGGGTFIIEAALKALDIAPGSRRHFAFEKLKTFQPDTWQAMKAEAQAQEKDKTLLNILGRDKDTRALSAARSHLRNAGLAKAVQVEKGEILTATPPPQKGLLIINPPYGTRLEDQQTMQRFYPRLGDCLKQNYSGWQVAIITADLSLPKFLRLKPKRKIPLFNGALESRLFLFDMVAGSMRDKSKNNEPD
jgi:putative N6-adenine-specific DNA methylase